MTIPAVNLDAALGAIAAPWSPHIVGEVNDYDLKLARIEGSFKEHTHDDTDELFIVLSGRLTLTLPDQTLTLGPMEVATVPRGTPHRPQGPSPGRRS
jgi:mannose-6-phosphate isomerase-like protein (cupin superfamily)